MNSFHHQRKNLFNSECYKDFLSWTSFGCSLMSVLSAAFYCSLFSATRVDNIRLSKVKSWSINPFLSLSVVLFSSLYLSSLSVYKPFFTIQNISSRFPLTLRVYLGLFIFVIPFSPIALHRSISLSLSLTLPWHGFLSTSSTGDRDKGQCVFFTFYSSLYGTKTIS